MNHPDQLKLSEAILAIRPDWHQAGVMSQLNILISTWTGTDPELFAHTINIAANPLAKTPGAFNTPMPTTTKTTPPKPDTKEPRCFICGNTKTQCEQLNDYEKRRGIPDPHDFESAEQAEANSSRATRTRKLEAIAALAQSKSIPPQLAKLLIILALACYTSAPLRKPK